MTQRMQRLQPTKRLRQTQPERGKKQRPLSEEPNSGLEIVPAKTLHEYI